MNKLAYPIVTLSGLAAVLLLLATGVGYQKGAYDLAQAFELLRIAALLGITGAGFALFFILWQRPQGAHLAVVAVSAVLGIVAFYMPYRQLLLSQQLPAIHDITTDTVNPPAFVAIARVRSSAQNPVTYAGAETAALQRQFYPDIRSLAFTQDPDAIFTAAMQVIEELGWRIAEANAEQGRIEATVTSRWFGLKDDVVIRITRGSAATTIVDLRSKSRVGITDVGSNARHIRRFSAALYDELR